MIPVRSSLSFLIICAACGLLQVACNAQQPLAPTPVHPQNQRPATGATVPSQPTGSATSTTVPPASLSITIVPEAEVYRVGQTAHFSITIFRDGQPLEGSSSTVTATFPVPTQPVVLTATSSGAYTFESLLTSAGQATLTVNVLHDYAGAVEATQRNIARIEMELAELRAALAGTTDDKERRVLEVKIANRESMLARLREKLATMQTPQVSNASTITVVPSDSTPPVFMRRWPERNNGGTYTNEALVAIEVAVVDAESGVDRVDLTVDGAAAVPMTYDAGLDRYRYLPAAPWTEGVHHIEFLARDVAGNESSWSFDFVADYTAPSVVSYSPVETTDSTPLLVVTVAEESGIFPFNWAVTLDAQPVTGLITSSGGTFTWTYQVSLPLIPGVHVLQVRAQIMPGTC